MFWDLASMLNPTHPMYKLANLINWETFERTFAPLYCKDNRTHGQAYPADGRSYCAEAYSQRLGRERRGAVLGERLLPVFLRNGILHHRQTLRTDRTRGVPPSHWRGGYGVDSQREHPSQPAA